MRAEHPLNLTPIPLGVSAGVQPSQPLMVVSNVGELNAAGVYVVGDSVWDLLAARRAGTLGIGLLSGGYGMEELERAGAYRVYDDPADLLNHLDEVGGRR